MAADQENVLTKNWLVKKYSFPLNMKYTASVYRHRLEYDYALCLAQSNLPKVLSRHSNWISWIQFDLEKFGVQDIMFKGELTILEDFAKVILNQASKNKKKITK